MLPLTYYFWNSYKKSGYVRWKLDRAEYDKQVSQQWKDSNVFVKKLVDNVLEDQEKTVKENITTLEIEVNNADKELKKIQASKSEEENNVTEIYINKKGLLDQETIRYACHDCETGIAKIAAKLLKKLQNWSIYTNFKDWSSRKPIRSPHTHSTRLCASIYWMVPHRRMVFPNRQNESSTTPPS